MPSHSSCSHSFGKSSACSSRARRNRVVAPVTRLRRRKTSKARPPWIQARSKGLTSRRVEQRLAQVLAGRRRRGGHRCAAGAGRGAGRTGPPSAPGGHGCQTSSWSLSAIRSPVHARAACSKFLVTRRAGTLRMTRKSIASPGARAGRPPAWRGPLRRSRRWRRRRTGRFPSAAGTAGRCCGPARRGSGRRCGCRGRRRRRRA